MSDSTPASAPAATASAHPAADAPLPLFDHARVATLAAALGAARMATMMAMLRAELAPLLDAPPGTAPSDPALRRRFDDAGHVHAVKGAAASLGAMRAAAACAMRERALRAGDAAAAHRHEPALILAATLTCRAIDTGDWAPPATA